MLLRSSSAALYLLLIWVASSALQSHPAQVLSWLESLELEGHGAIAAVTGKRPGCPVAVDNWAQGMGVTQHILQHGASEDGLAELSRSLWTWEGLGYQEQPSKAWEKIAEKSEPDFFWTALWESEKAVGIKWSRDGSSWMFGKLFSYDVC